jgi:hypothetical protein
MIFLKDDEKFSRNEKREIEIDEWKILFSNQQNQEMASHSLHFISLCSSLKTLPRWMNDESRAVKHKWVNWILVFLRSCCFVEWNFICWAANCHKMGNTWESLWDFFHNRQHRVNIQHSFVVISISIFFYTQWNLIDFERCTNNFFILFSFHSQIKNKWSCWCLLLALISNWYHIL